MHMHQMISGTLVALVLLGVIMIGNTVQAQPDPAKGVDPRPVAMATNDFAFRLYAELNKKNTTTNLFISPTSLSMALSMTYNGAAGTTQAGMAKALGIQGMELAALNKGQAALLDVMEKSDPKVTVAVANALFANKGYKFLDDFMQRNKEYYRARVTTTDVTSDAGVKEINDWVAQQTRNKITDLLKNGDLDRLTRLVLVNAIYFKGAWTEKFDPLLTREADFSQGDWAKPKKVQMMRISKEFRYMQDEKFQAVNLPFGQGRMSMYIFLPAKKIGLKDFSAQLTAANWKQWMGKFNKVEVLVNLPRFKASYEEMMNKPLTALGMGDAFSDAADFSGMDGTKGLYIKLVRHKAVLEVNEEGAEAAAATGVVMNLKSAPRTIEMTVDRPFFCAICDNDTGAILFMGNIVNPE